jgi:hypothetical protein
MGLQIPSVDAGVATMVDRTIRGHIPVLIDRCLQCIVTSVHHLFRDMGVPTSERHVVSVLRPKGRLGVPMRVASVLVLESYSGVCD